mmetsp:Transcript_89788/g.287829  ORF Transcript_89788/g.287829 Transcript_89788/m.287829 type:complete len:117 (+) Transcript_89788:204-554(+)
MESARSEEDAELSRLSAEFHCERNACAEQRVLNEHRAAELWACKQDSDITDAACSSEVVLARFLREEKHQAEALDEELAEQEKSWQAKARRLRGFLSEGFRTNPVSISMLLLARPW